MDQAISAIPHDWQRLLGGNLRLIQLPDHNSSGHILINTGLADGVPQIKSGIEQLGFKFSDVKILTATHSHIDHVAGLAEIKRVTGARLMMSEQDADVLESGGKSDFRWGDDERFEAVKVDRKLKSDKIELGGGSFAGTRRRESRCPCIQSFRA